MAVQASFEPVFLRHLADIERIATSLARRHGLRGADAEDFAAWIRLRLVEDDYALLRKFRGDAAMTTYLTVVIASLGRDYRYRHGGRWRPSAEARRRGPVAVRLEALVRRSGYHLRHAAELLRTAGETDLTDRQLATLLAELPDRPPLRPVLVDNEVLHEVPSASSVTSLPHAAERDAVRDRASRTIAAALRELSPEERTILRMRYWCGSTVAEIARVLGAEQKPLYRRIERVLATLRARLAESGIGPETVEELLYDDDAAVPH